MAVTQKTFPIKKMAVEGDQLDGEDNVEYLHWVSKGATVGDDLLVQDDDGNTVWEEVADVVNFSRIHVIKHKINKLKVTTMDSGTLYVITANLGPESVSKVKVQYS